VTYPHFWIRKLRVLKKGQAVYDQTFHQGVNIISGENGSGKSTISDFIFYILGGEFENWKTAAAACDQVQAEIVTRGGVLSLRRDIGKAQTPMQLFYGPAEEAERHGLDGWNMYPIRRSENRESFSQIFFRSCGIPEAQSQGASNITMHQIMRILYSDQRTPSAFLFRFESFDTREIREAVGDLICGLSVYERYEIELSLRSLEKEFDEKQRQYSALIAAMPREEALANVGAIDDRLKTLSEEYERLSQEIADADQHVKDDQIQAFVKEKTRAAAELRVQRERTAKDERTLQVGELEIEDLTSFISYLEALSSTLPKAQESADIMGNIEFTHCPACLTELSGKDGPQHCVLCGAAIDPEQERSRYLQIKLDIDIQIRESHQLLEAKRQEASQIDRELRRQRREYQEKLSEYTIKYDISTSPRESFVGERYQRLGRIDREALELEQLRDRVAAIQALSEEKAELQARIAKLKDRERALESSNRNRKLHAATLISESAKGILRQDLERQAEFRNPQAVTLNFGDNAILVDGKLNFAESSNVIAKNAAILALLLSATQDSHFYHPRFSLFDNIEDKGMEQKRSHNFQDIIVRLSEKASLEHQIILTTSMLNPDLDKAKYLVGPHYTHDQHTLDFRLEQG
jgi:hypothetical protein